MIPLGARHRSAVDASPAEARIKGAAVREFLRWYLEKLGPAAFAAARSKMPASLRTHFDLDGELLGVVSSVWYPAPAVHALLDVLLAGVSASERTRLAREGARAVLRVTLSGIYAGVFRLMMTPDRYARYSQRLWERFYDTGTMTKEVLSPRHHRTVISDWGAHHPFICELHTWSSEHIYTAMGCRNAVVERLGCVAEGADACSFDIRWR
jgi:hypothetical protein